MPTFLVYVIHGVQDFCLLLAIAFFGLVGLKHFLQFRRTRRFNRTLACVKQFLPKLLALDFVDGGMPFNLRYSATWRGDREFWPDAPYVVVVRKEMEPVGVIGFYLTPDRMDVYQLQGFRGIQFHEGSFSEYMHSCLEQLVDVLSVDRVRILAARHNHWYKHPHGVPTLRVPRLRERMQEMYDGESERRGYCSQGRWWCKPA